MDKIKMSEDVSNHEGPIHVVADALMNHFEGSGATNYIEQTFVDKEDSSRSFVLTMQMKNGLTPCEKLRDAQERIAELEAFLNKFVEASESEIYITLEEAIELQRGNQNEPI